MPKVLVTLLVAVVAALVSCRTMELENKAILVNRGDEKAQVLKVMGTPQDRQFLADYEVWQYCITGAGFGYHDFRAIWFRPDNVIGITSYKDNTPASSCRGHFRTLRVQDAPDYVIEMRTP
jgi:hypothetical protein